MATQKLTKAQMEELSKLVTQGIRPQDLADRYQVGVSTIHNYKQRLKELGLPVSPAIQGQPVQALAEEPVEMFTTV